MAQNEKDFIHPEIEKFCDNLKKIIVAENFIGVTPDKQIEEILIRSDFILQPKGNYIMINSNLTLKEFFDLDKN